MASVLLIGELRHVWVLVSRMEISDSPTCILQGGKKKTGDVKRNVSMLNLIENEFLRYNI